MGREREQKRAHVAPSVRGVSAEGCRRAGQRNFVFGERNRRRRCDVAASSLDPELPSSCSCSYFSENSKPPPPVPARRLALRRGGSSGRESRRRRRRRAEAGSCWNGGKRGEATLAAPDDDDGRGGSCGRSGRSCSDSRRSSPSLPFDLFAFLFFFFSARRSVARSEGSLLPRPGEARRGALGGRARCAAGFDAESSSL